LRKGRLLSVGLLGRLFAILLLTLTIEYVASTILYERSSRALVRDDEAHRLAEHLVIARKLVSEQSWPERPGMAERLTTSRYYIHWAGSINPGLPSQGEPTPARARMIEWEPSLAGSNLQVRLVPVGRRAQLFGALQLGDGTWLHFRAITTSAGVNAGLRRILLPLLPAAVLVVLSALLFRETLRPMRMLAHAADRIGRSGGIALPEVGPREVKRVIRAFNAMQARIHQLITDRTQALAAVGHDLRTPLARLQLRADAIPEPALRQSFETDIAEMEAMVGSLLSYVGGEDDPEKPVRTDVAVLAQTIVDDAADHGGAAVYVGQDHIEAEVRPIGLKRALANLVENALHYGRVARVAVQIEDANLVIRVDDDGPGIPEDRLAEVVQPFVRLDPARSRNTSGLGLGLAIVARAAEMEGGTLHLVNRPEGGLRAELRLPRG